MSIYSKLIDDSVSPVDVSGGVHIINNADVSTSEMVICASSDTRRVENDKTNATRFNYGLDINKQSLGFFI